MVIRFNADDGVELAGEFVSRCRPSSSPLVVIVPGGSWAGVGEGGNAGLIPLARSMAENGLSVFLYDGRGFGHSGGSREQQIDTITDLRAALRYLEDRKGCNISKIGLLGMSVGGAGALKLATEQRNISAVMCYGTLPSYALAKSDGRTLEVIEGYWRSSKRNLRLDEFVGQYGAINPAEFAAGVRAHVFLSGGSSDERFFRWKEQTELAEAFTSASSVSLQMFKGWGHAPAADSPGFQAVCAAISGWFREILHKGRKPNKNRRTST